MHFALGEELESKVAVRSVAPLREADITIDVCQHKFGGERLLRTNENAARECIGTPTIAPSALDAVSAKRNSPQVVVHEVARAYEGVPDRKINYSIVVEVKAVGVVWMDDMMRGRVDDFSSGPENPQSATAKDSVGSEGWFPVDCPLAKRSLGLPRTTFQSCLRVLQEASHSSQAERHARESLLHSFDILMTTPSCDAYRMAGSGIVYLCHQQNSSRQNIKMVGKAAQRARKSDA